VNQPIELRHEEVVIEREPASSQAGQSQASEQQFQEKELVINLKREEPVVEKQTTAAGQVAVQTRSASEQKNIQEQVRHEDIDIVRSGNAPTVMIGPNIQSSSGAAESPSGAAADAEKSSSGGTITDPAMLSNPANAASLAGRSVELSGLKVQQAAGRLITLSQDNGESLLVVCPESAGNFKAGDTVDLTGTVKQPAGSTADMNLGEEARQKLSAHPLYIQATTIKASGK